MSENTNQPFVVEGEQVTAWLRQRAQTVGPEAMTSIANRFLGAQYQDRDGQAWTIDGFNRENRQFVIARGGENRTLSGNELSEGQVKFENSSRGLYREVMGLPEDMRHSIDGAQVTGYLRRHLEVSGADPERVSAPIIGCGFHFKGESTDSLPWRISGFNSQTRTFIATRGQEQRPLGVRSMNEGTVSFPASKTAVFNTISHGRQPEQQAEFEKSLSFSDWRDLRQARRDAGDDVLVGDMAFAFDLYQHDDQHGEGRFSSRSLGSMPPAIFLHSRSRLANPHRTGRMDEHEAAHSLWDHYRRTLLARNAGSLALLTEFAREARKASENEIREVRSGLADSEQAGTKISGTGGVAALMDQGLSQEEAERIDDQRHAQASSKRAFDTNIHVVAPSAAEAHVARGVMKLALEIMPLSDGLRDRGTIIGLDDLPSNDVIEGHLRAHRPALYQDRDNPRIGVYAAWGSEEATAKFLSNSIKKTGYTFVHTPSDALSSALQSHVGEGNRIVNVDKRDALKPMQAFNRLMDASDKLVISVPEDNEFVQKLVAEASRRGKIGTLLDTQGNVIERSEVETSALKAVPSWLDQLRDQNAAAFDVPAGSPEGRLGLASLHRSAQGDEDAASSLSKADREKIAAIPAKLSEVVSMAQDEEGRVTLYRDHGVSGGAIRLLADRASLTNARETLRHSLAYCQTNNIRLVGREEMPESLRNGADAPEFLFVQAKDPEEFKKLDGIVSFVGAKDLLPGMAAKSAEMHARFAEAGRPVAHVEGHGVPAPDSEALSEAKAPVVVFLAGNHREPRQAEALEWEKVTRPAGLEASSADKSQIYTIAVDPDAGKAQLVVRPVTDQAEQGPSQAAQTVQSAVVASFEYDAAKDGLSRQDRSALFERLKEEAGKAEEKRLFSSEGKHSIQLDWHETAKDGFLEASSHQGSRMIIGLNATKDRIQMARLDANGTESLVSEKARDDERAFEANKKKIVSELMDTAGRHHTQSDPSLEPKRQRQAIVEAGGFVVSETPPVQLVNSRAARGFVKMDTPGGDLDRHRAELLAVKASDVTVFTQLSYSDPSAHAVAAALNERNQRKGFHLFALAPDTRERNLREVDGSRLLGSNNTTGADLISRLGISGTDQIAVREAKAPFALKVSNPSVGAEVISKALEDRKARLAEKAGRTAEQSRGGVSLEAAE